MTGEYHEYPPSGQTDLRRSNSGPPDTALNAQTLSRRPPLSSTNNVVFPNRLCAQRRKLCAWQVNTVLLFSLLFAFVFVRMFEIAVWRYIVYFMLAALHDRSKLPSAFTWLFSRWPVPVVSGYCLCNIFTNIPPPSPTQKLYISPMFDFLQTMTLPKKQSGACPSENSWASELELRQIRLYASQIATITREGWRVGLSSTEAERGLATWRLLTALRW